MRRVNAARGEAFAEIRKSCVKVRGGTLAQRAQNMLSGTAFPFGEHKIAFRVANALSAATLPQAGKQFAGKDAAEIGGFSWRMPVVN